MGGKFDVDIVQGLMMLVGSGVKEMDTSLYRKEESRSLIVEEFGKCFEIRLRHKMRLDCE